MSEKIVAHHVMPVEYGAAGWEHLLKQHRREVGVAIIEAMERGLFPTTLVRHEWEDGKEVLYSFPAIFRHLLRQNGMGIYGPPFRHVATMVPLAKPTPTPEPISAAFVLGFDPSFGLDFLKYKVLGFDPSFGLDFLKYKVTLGELSFKPAVPASLGIATEGLLPEVEGLIDPDRPYSVAVPDEG